MSFCITHSSLVFQPWLYNNLQTVVSHVVCLSLYAYFLKISNQGMFKALAECFQCSGWSAIGMRMSTSCYIRMNQSTLCYIRIHYDTQQTLSNKRFHPWFMMYFRGIQEHFGLFTQDNKSRRTTRTIQGIHSKLDADRTTHNSDFLYIWTVTQIYWNGSCVIYVLVFNFTIAKFLYTIFTWR